MKIRGIISNSLDLNKCYPGEILGGFNHPSDTLRNANADDVTFKPYNSKST